MKIDKRSRRNGRGVRVILLLSLGLSLCVFPVLPEEAVRATGLTTTELRNPTTNTDGVTTWDYIYFGNYWQNDTNGDGVADQNDEKEPIKWRVLSVDGNDAFLLADQNLDSQPYNEIGKDVTWETCTLRKWLNSDFLNNAFDSSERAAIMDTTVVNEDNSNWETEGGNDTTDQVYLLSIADACNTAYGFNGEFHTESKTREAKNTPYAEKCGAWTSTSTLYEGNGSWWLRSPGRDSEHASIVSNYGCGIDWDYDVGGIVYSDNTAVRPALHLNLNASSDAIPSSLWTYAGWVTSEGEKGGSDDGVVDLPTSTGGTSEPSASSPFSSSALGMVMITSAKRKKGGMIALQYKKVSGAKGYQVQYSAKKNFKGKKSKVASRTKYTIKKWKKKKTCYIRIRAYKLQAGKKVYGKWSRVKKVS